MNTLNSFATIALIGGLATLGGCSNGGSSGSADALPEVDVDVPTQEQADAEAAAEIDADNADEAFAELQSEIEREAGGGG